MRRGKLSGLSLANKLIRRSDESIEWSKSILNRDNRTCKICKRKIPKGSRRIHAHHILPFSNNMELRFNLDNGVAVCKPCHKTIHSKRFNFKANEQVGTLVGNYPLDFNF